MRFGWLAASAAFVMSATQAQAATVIELTEIEPNDTIATAQAIPVTLTTSVRLTGTLEGTGFDNVDFFSFLVDNSNCEPSRPACNLITVDTGPGILRPFLSVFDPTGTNVVSSPQSTSFQRNNAAAGTWTLAVRRSSAAAPAAYSLVASLAPGVPEPTSWVTMILGMGAIGAALRRRRVSFAAA